MAISEGVDLRAVYMGELYPLDDGALMDKLANWAAHPDSWTLGEAAMIQTMGKRVAANPSSPLKPLVDAFLEVAGPYAGFRDFSLREAGQIVRFANKVMLHAGSGAAYVHPAGTEEAAKTEAQIGDRMPAGHPHAGWIYAGISKTTQQPFYVAPKDSGVFQWKEAMAFAAKDGSRLPSREELDQLHDAKDKGALKGTFNLSGSNPAGWYWSSRDDGNISAWAQRLSDGSLGNDCKNYYSSLRCVR
jgi:hypothetical protein